MAGGIQAGRQPDQVLVPRAFVKYLITSLKHCVQNEHRKWRRQCRDLGRDVSKDVVGGDPTPFLRRPWYEEAEPPVPERAD